MSLYPSSWRIEITNSRGTYSRGSIVLRLLALLVAAALLLPLVYLIIRSAESPTASLRILTRATTLTALLRTLALAAAVTVCANAIAIPTAWLTTRTDLYGHRFWAIATALPLVLPSYVAAYLFVASAGPNGAISNLLGLPSLPGIYGFTGACFVLTLLSYPYVLLSVRASFKQLDPSMVEAARSLGLSPRQAFFQITLPHLRPGIVAGSLLVALYVLRDFGAVSMLRYNTLTRIIYLQYQSFSDRGLAAALGLLLVVCTGVLVYGDVRTRGHSRYARQSIGTARQLKLVALGKWQWVIQFCLLLLVLIALVFPMAGLLYWLQRGLAHSEVIGSLWQSAISSFSASLAAAIFTVLAALPVALLAVKTTGSNFGRWLERLSWVGFALPGIVIALALAFFSINYATPLYGSISVLILAWIILFIPQAVGTIRAALLQQSAHLEEAGRSLGFRPITTFRRITLPLITPGLLSGGALVFLTCMKELPATLILSPLGFKTLSMDVWANISEAFFARAAAPSLLLILLSSIPLALLTLREK